MWPITAPIPDTSYCLRQRFGTKNIAPENYTVIPAEFQLACFETSHNSPPPKKLRNPFCLHNTKSSAFSRKVSNSKESAATKQIRITREPREPPSWSGWEMNKSASDAGWQTPASLAEKGFRLPSLPKKRTKKQNSKLGTTGQGGGGSSQVPDFPLAMQRSVQTIVKRIFAEKSSERNRECGRADTMRLTERKAWTDLLWKRTRTSLTISH